MKKFLLLCLIFPLTLCSISASEITEDYFDIASNYCIEGNYNEALSYLNKILAIEPANSKAKELKNSVIRVMSPTTSSYISAHNIQIKQAFSFKKQGNKSKELSSLINSANSGNVWGCYYLAEYYRENKNYVNALSYYQKTLSIKNDFSQSYLGMAQTYYDNNNFNSAVINLNKYIQSNPRSDTAYALKAMSNLNLNNTSAALSDINIAITLNDDLSYRLIEAKILYKQGNYTLAKEKLEKLSKNIKTSEVYKLMGLCDYNTGNYTNALLNLDKAIILSDEDKTLNSRYNEIKEKLEKR